ncbi:hypothetical protein BS78_08G098300 [Paspalum vaginatum]|nr:hypothetical protein BS78_08G098300 [Paspalum vaginatum]
MNLLGLCHWIHLHPLAKLNYQMIVMCQDEDDEDSEEGLDGQERCGFGSLFLSDQQHLPGYIGRQNCEPLTTQRFFSLHHNWQQLLDGKRTYLRAQNRNRVLEYNHDDFLFEIPEPFQRALGCQEPILVLVYEAAKNSIIQQKLKILSEHYVGVRRTRVDGSCFYRAFLFSYLENLGKMQCSQAEITRLMECVARSREHFCHLEWNNAYFSNPEAFFSSVVSEFEHLVNSAANGLSADKLYKRSLQEITSSRILSLLRLLTEVDIRTHEEDYKSAFPQQTNALLISVKAVRPLSAEASTLHMRALSYALGIPLCLALVDTTMNNGIIQVQCYDFFPQSISSGVSTTSGPLKSMRSYYLSSSTDKQGQGRDSNSVMLPAGSLVSSDRMPLVTLLRRKGQCDILYRK